MAISRRGRTEKAVHEEKEKEKAVLNWARVDLDSQVQ
jgi:hypothetical protein